MTYSVVFLGLLLAGLVLFGACTPNKIGSDKGDKTGVAAQTMSRNVAIGYIGSTDADTRQLVKRLLFDKGVEVSFSGSVVHYVLVDKDQAQAAQEVLKSSTELKGKWVKYLDLNAPSK